MFSRKGLDLVQRSGPPQLQQHDGQRFRGAGRGRHECRGSSMDGGRTMRPSGSNSNITAGLEN